MSVNAARCATVCRDDRARVGAGHRSAQRPRDRRERRRAAGGHGDRNADRHRVHAHRRDRRRRRRTSCRTCRPVRTGWRCRCKGSAPTCRPASSCRSAPRPRSTWRLAVGSLEETVSVEAAAPLVDVRSAGISEVVEQERIVELPLQGRQVTDLIVLAGAAVNTGDVSGQSRDARDGRDFGRRRTSRRRVSYTPRRRHAQQHRTTTRTCRSRSRTRCRSSACPRAACRPQSGVHAVASVNGVTKSGTNRFSRECVRVLSRSAVQCARRVCAPSGPTVRSWATPCAAISSAGRSAGRSSRTSSSSSAGTRGRGSWRSLPATSRSCPPPAMIAGDFTALASPACNGGTQVTLRAPFVNNRVDPARPEPGCAEDRRTPDTCRARPIRVAR